MTGKRFSRAWWFAPFLLALLGASPQPGIADVAEWLRRGNAAFAREDFETAVECYQRAEILTTDPGLVAFNMGAAYYRLGKYRAAEQHFRRCLEDAAGSRRARALYNFGNSLVRRSRASDVEALREAVASYEACLREGHADPDLAADATDNLKLARVVLAQAEAARKNNPNQRDNPDDDPDRPRPPRNPARGSGDDSFDPTRGSGPEQGGNEGQRAGQRPVPVGQQPQPGAGTQPVLRDGESPPLSPQETEALLKTVEKRIGDARRQRQQTPVPPSPRNEKDW
jgi:tetratricopeptide (TPR) repeat protein